MHLMYLPVLDASGNPTGERRYTLDKVLDGQVTLSAHPARFSPDDKWSRQRLALRKRYGPLYEQQMLKAAAQGTGKADALPLASEMEALTIMRPRRTPLLTLNPRRKNPSRLDA